MFWLVTQAAKWKTQVKSIFTYVGQIKFFSAYTYQNIKTTVQVVDKLKISSIRSGTQFLITNEKLPDLPRQLKKASPIYNNIQSIYKKVAYTVTKVSKPVKNIVMSKKFSAALAAVSTAVPIVQLGMTGLPIILLPILAAMGTYAKEYRDEQLKADTQKLEQQLTGYEYGQKIPKISVNAPMQNMVAQEICYKPPKSTEIIKVGLELTLSGLVGGMFSVGFVSKALSCGYNVYAEVKQYQKIHSIKSKIKESRKKKQKLIKKDNKKPKKWRNKITSSRGSSSLNHKKSTKWELKLISSRNSSSLSVNKKN